MWETIVDLPHEDATAALGRRLALVRRIGDVIALVGPLGAGKSSLARAYIEAATGEPNAPSPTFGLAHLYEAPDATIHHFDLFRLERTEEIDELGLEDALEDGVCLVEWPERIVDRLPPTTLIVNIAIDGPGRRAVLRGDETWRDRLNAVNAPAMGDPQ
ncbi:MAG: tRNA (adenosine(37)-N6)-threonylcarbamoyltransferase complex ATPase subunit type 1 TsaE [Alphaproteobacteria bacterium]|nr:tRNA (adenosine(37)-N6)-threonylcarbamoyltransferase complex ATPase subunit type 1 TsaE [Alphaproteobacteria bacterium]